jgi:hypothetical protein
VLRLARIPLLLSLAAPASGAPCYLLERPGARELAAAELRAKPPAFPFPRGERLEYAVRYFGIEVGRAAVEIARFVAYDGRRMAHVVATARTNDFFSLIYRVDDRSEAWIDTDRLVTVRTATHTRHGWRREIYEEVDFDWKTHFVRIFEAKRHRKRAHDLAFDFGPFVHDTFDVFYAIRSLPLAPGYSAHVPVYASQKVYGLRLDVVGKERIRSPLLGEVETLVLRPNNSLDGKPQGDGKGKIFVLAGARHVPVRMTGWFRSTQGFRIGSARGELVDYRAGDPDWPAPQIRPLEPRAEPAPSVEGRPVWNPPARIVEARRRAEVGPLDRRFTLAWPDDVGCPEEPEPIS